MSESTEVLIVGGGVIGVSCAYYIVKSGRKVRVLEMDEIGMGCSYGNAGLIVPGRPLPLPAPGVPRKVIKWMFDPESPFYIKLAPRFELLRWVWGFCWNCTVSHLEKAMPVIRDLNLSSRELFGELARGEDIRFRLNENGLLKLFNTEKGYEEGVKEVELIRRVGLEAEVLDKGQVQKRLDGASERILGGVYYPQDAHIDPYEFVIGLAEKVEKIGGKIQTRTEVIGFETKKRRITSVRTTRGSFSAEEVVLCTGAWTALLGKLLGLRLPIEPAKGYSITLQSADTMPPLPLLLDERKVAVTPLNDKLRLAGTLELCGLDLSLNERRVNALLRATISYQREFVQGEVLEIWRGLRPCTPDGLPIIGRPSAYENLIIASGHAMKGLSMGPATGSLVKELICGGEPCVGLEPLTPDRFS